MKPNLSHYKHKRLLGGKRLRGRTGKPSKAIAPVNSPHPLSLKASDPQKYAAIVEGLSSGASLMEVAKEFGVSKASVGRICVAEFGLDHARSLVAQNLTTIARLCSESLIGDIDSLNATQRSILLGIACDKLAALESRGRDAGNLVQVVNVTNISEELAQKLLKSLAEKSQTEPPTIDV